LEKKSAKISLISQISGLFKSYTELMVYGFDKAQTLDYQQDNQAFGRYNTEGVLIFLF
jgi:hypothetical protein